MWWIKKVARRVFSVYGLIFALVVVWYFAFPEFVHVQAEGEMTTAAWVYLSISLVSLPTVLLAIGIEEMRQDETKE